MSPPRWVLYGGTSPEMLGFLPGMLDDEDPRPAAEQLNESYAHGGGWMPFGKGQWIRDGFRLRYPGDPWLEPRAATVLGDETILFYDHALMLIEALDGSFEVGRVD